MNWETVAQLAVLIMFVAFAGAIWISMLGDNHVKLHLVKTYGGHEDYKKAMKK